MRKTIQHEVNVTDYYPFGKTISERTWSVSKTRYDFNGKETDQESGYQDYGFRDYDVEICRFLQVDPLHGKYPELSTYQFASNTPIMAIDLDGLEAYLTIDGKMVGLGKQGMPGGLYLVDSNSGFYDFDGDGFEEPDWDSAIKLNSELTLRGRDGIEKEPTGISKLSDYDIAKIVAFGTQVIKNNGGTFNAAKLESVGTRENGNYGFLDFKFSVYDLLGLPDQNLIQINEVLYNANEAGNYLWGLVLTYNDIWIKPSSIAQIKTLQGSGYFLDGRFDENHEQKAIIEGSEKGRELKGNIDFVKEVENFLKTSSQSDIDRVKEGAKGKNQVGGNINRK